MSGEGLGRRILELGVMVSDLKLYRVVKSKQCFGVRNIEVLRRWHFWVNFQLESLEEDSRKLLE